jgi:phosphatidylserine/phosphatidylglycerophosphate/cardiolipin synthase-like enzyme
MRRLAVLAAALLPLAVSPAWADGPAEASVSTCFTPGPTSCAEAIVAQLDAARAKVRVQAYYLTSPVILHAIAAARRRGLDVAVILDKSQDRHDSPRGRYTGAIYLANAGVPVWIDDAPAIAHSKVIVLDDREVITGSFNFTKAADERNAENVVVLDSPEVASWFTRNWDLRRSVSRSFGME